MPFSSWFGGTDTAAASTSPQHIRKVSLGSSSDASASRLVDIRAKVCQSRHYNIMSYFVTIFADIRSHYTFSLSYIQSKSYTKSSTSLSRHRTSHHANANRYNTTTQRKPIAAIEPGMDDSTSTHMRIDQGLIDASNEAVQNQKPSTSSWWSSFYQPLVTVDQPKPHMRALSAPDISSNTDKPVSSHRRIVSKTTYRA